MAVTAQHTLLGRLLDYVVEQSKEIDPKAFTLTGSSSDFKLFPRDLAALPGVTFDLKVTIPGLTDQHRELFKSKLHLPTYASQRLQQDWGSRRGQEARQKGLPMATALIWRARVMRSGQNRCLLTVGGLILVKRSAAHSVTA